jgi:hypothetical protein
MSAVALDPHPYFAALRELIPPGLHPSDLQTCHEWVSQMHGAVDAGDHAELGRLVRALDAKLASERCLAALPGDPGFDLAALALGPTNEGTLP